MSSQRTDPGSQTPNFPASNSDNGVESVVRYFERGTDEVRNLLKNECSVIYECSCCRSLFRSIINFVAHKRTMCRTLQCSVRAEQLEMVIRDQAKKQQGKPENKELDTSAQSALKRNGKNSRNLRRFNAASNLAKHIRPINVHLERANTDIELQTLPRVMRNVAQTSIVDGKQIVDQLPIELSLKEHIPENRVALVMPRECSVRCGEMQLRRRRGTQLANNRAADGVRELTGEEIELIERIPSAIPVDFSNLHCEDKRCLERGLLPFNSFLTLAHHLAIQHQLDYADESLVKDAVDKPFIRCFLCDMPPFQGLKDLQKHFNAAHSMVRQQHNRFRLDQQTNNDNSTKRKQDPSPSSFRSLSPLSLPADEEEEEEGEEELNEEEEIGEETKSTKRKCFRRPILFTPISKAAEKQQHIEAAKALKNWIQQSGGGSGEVKHSFDEEAEGETDFSGDGAQNSRAKLLENEMPLLQSAKAQVDGAAGLINEEEARKIDQLLNSKINAEERLVENDALSGDDPTDQEQEFVANNGEEEEKEEESSSQMLSNTRERRSRKPNRKFLYPEGSMLEKSKKSNHDAKNKSTTPSDLREATFDSSVAHSKESTPKFSPPSSALLKRRTESIRIKSPKKRKSSTSQSSARTKKRITETKVVNSGEGGIRRSTPTSNAGQIRTEEFLTPHSHIPVEDFVLPASIATKKSNSKRVYNTKKRKSQIVQRNEKGENFGQSLPQLIGETDSVAISKGPSPEQSEVDEGKVEADEVDVKIKEEGDETEPSSNRATRGPKLDLVHPQLTKESLPTMITGRHREELVFYTPKAKKIKEEEYHRQSSSGSSRRKQSFSSIDMSETDGLSLVATDSRNRTHKGQVSVDSNGTSETPPPPKPKDLTQVPVYLTEHQRDLFFKALKPLFNINSASDGFWQCGECGETLKCVKDGRRHMVSHIRVMRMRCSLCDAGAFFCSDMRVHLMYRHCEKLSLAPEDFITPGVPCMDKEKADLLTQLVDPYHPGRVKYTTGKIVSWSNPRAYLPDPKMERNILGPALPGYLACSSPRKQFKSSILASGRKNILKQQEEARASEAMQNVASTSSAQFNQQEAALTIASKLECKTTSTTAKESTPPVAGENSETSRFQSVSVNDHNYDSSTVVQQQFSRKTTQHNNDEVVNPAEGDE